MKIDKRILIILMILVVIHTIWYIIDGDRIIAVQADVFFIGALLYARLMYNHQNSK